MNFYVMPLAHTALGIQHMASTLLYLLLKLQ